MARSPAAEPAAAGLMVPVAHRVAASRPETHDTRTLTLEPVGEELAPFAPGQFAMLYAFGVGEVPISISGGAGGDGPLVHTLRAVGRTTEVLCSLQPGDYVGSRGPFGSAWPIAGAEGRDVVVVAGGIGLAPLRPLIEHVLSHRDRYGRLTVAYGGRTAADLLYVAELERWRSHLDADVGVTVDSAAGGWRGRVGVVTTLLDGAGLDPGNTAAFVCGPEVMMRFAVAALRDVGLPEEAIHLSMERSMKCAVGHCGHCQLRELFVCRDGPVLRSDVAVPLMRVREL